MKHKKQQKHKKRKYSGKALVKHLNGLNERRFNEEVGEALKELERKGLITKASNRGKSKNPSKKQ